MPKPSDLLQGTLDLMILKTLYAIGPLHGFGIARRIESFVALREVNLGLQADHIFQTMLILPEQSYKTVEQVTRFFRPCWRK